MRALLAFCVVGTLAVVADARPGGGHTYSGGSSGSYSSSGSYRSSWSGGGSGGGDQLLSGGATLALVLGLSIAILLAAAVANRNNVAYTTPARPAYPPPLDLGPVSAHDPAFSRVVFEDFAFRLYAAAQRARHDRGELAKLAPYLAPPAFDTLVRRSSRVEQVVVGNLRIVDAVADAAGTTRLVVAIEANLASMAGTLHASERWTFVRAQGVKTRPPEQTRIFACPNCNAPFSSSADPRTCAHCGSAIETGRFEWTVESISVAAETSVGVTLTGTVEEVGNDFPTVTDDTAHTRLMQLRKDDPNITWDAFTARVKMIYERVSAAWNAQDLGPVRGLVTSSLLEYLQFWIEEYKRQRLANKLDDARISHIALARVTRDPWFDAITVRVYADGLDYTLDAEGAVVGGSRYVRREYTEYWTFLRSSARRGPITAQPTCPNCGAPLAISDTGACTHCNAEVENGSFDWTLSKIEQDDVYRG